MNVSTMGYLKVLDKMENVAEGWQIVRLLNDDLVCADLLPEEIASLTPGPLASGGTMTIRRRRGKTLSPVVYRIDPVSGDVTREEGEKKFRFLAARCRQFDVERCIQPFGTSGRQRSVFFRVKLNIGEVRERAESAKPVEVETRIFPLFLNLRLHSRYRHEGFPDEAR